MLYKIGTYIEMNYLVCLLNGIRLKNMIFCEGMFL